MATKTSTYVGKMVVFRGAYGEIKRGIVSFVDEDGFLNGKDSLGNIFIISEKEVIN